MIVPSWNCRGLGQPRAIPVLHELIRTHKAEILFLSETLVYSARIEEIRVNLGFVGAFAVDITGRSGGLALLWRNKDLCHIQDFSANHINAEIKEDDKPIWRLTGFYGYPERQRRRDSWNLQYRLHNQSNLPWCCIGDFNDMLNPEDKRGRVDHPSWLINGFREVVATCGLIDLNLNGYPYTWAKSKGTLNTIEERIDRALVNTNWATLFPQGNLSNCTAPVSNHSPILLTTESKLHNGKRKGFRFENKWLREPALSVVVRDSWENSSNTLLLDKLQHVAINLQRWGRSVTRKFRVNIDRCQKEIEIIRFRADPASVRRAQDLNSELIELLSQEEIFWKQRAKAYWLKDGDMNSKFFHKTATTRIDVNIIKKLTDENGNSFEQIDDLCTIAKQYFVDLYSPISANCDMVTSKVEQVISTADNTELLKPFQLEEVKQRF